MQIGSARPPYADGPQGPIQIRGIGIRYRITENDQPPPPPPSCIRDFYTACLLNGRFKVTAQWQTATGSGPAQVMFFGGARAESDQSIFMCFFNENNFEIGIKMVDACTPPFNRFWELAAKVEAVEDGRNEYGVFLRAEGTLTGPNGRTLSVVTIWLQSAIDSRVRFVTLKPRKEKKS